jgi:hypothetical protein
LFSLKQQEINKGISGNKEFLLHREYGHYRLPNLKENPLAKDYIKHLLAGLKGLIK